MMSHKPLLIIGSFLILVVMGTLISNFVSAKAPVNDDKSKAKQVKIGGIEWYVDYDAALKVAKEKKKPIWLHFGENPG